MTITAFPLSWPTGWPRTKYAQQSRFDVSFTGARDGLVVELERMRAKNIVLSTNVELRSDGLPYANQRAPGDVGVAVYWTTRDGQHRCIACDKWNSVKDNMRAIEKTVEALRGLERWGSSQIVERAFAGFKALPAPEDSSNGHWWRVLGLSQGATKDEIKSRRVELARLYHPDSGSTPDNDLMAAINAAVDEGLRNG